MSSAAGLVIVGLAVLLIWRGPDDWRMTITALIMLGLVALVLWFGQWLPVPLVALALAYVAVRGLRMHWWARRGGDPW